LPLEEWSLTGPIGLEQGFTLPAAPAWAANGGEVELVVEADALSVDASGDGAVLVGASGERL